MFALDTVSSCGAYEFELVSFNMTNLCLPPLTEPCTSFDNLDDDGDLKFRSKRVIWAPRINRQNGKAFESPTADLTLRTSPLKLLDLCILALSKNVSMIDHVGLVPYEVFAPVLKDASTEDLYRIQKCNPVSGVFHCLVSTIMAFLMI